MVDEPPRGQPGFEPLPGWPGPPAGAAPPPPPSPPPPWTRPPPHPGPPGALQPGPEPRGGPATTAAPGPSGPGRLAGLRSRRGLLIAGGLLALLLIAAAAAVVVTGGGGESSDAGGTSAGGGRSIAAPKAAPGKDIPLLDGRLVLVARPGWEVRDQTADTATVQLALGDPGGRELLSTLVLTALPGGGDLEPTLTVDGGTRFEVKTEAGPLQATAVPPPATRVLAATVRLPSTFLFSLSVFALDGKPVDVPMLQKLFVEQVVPQLRYP